MPMMYDFICPDCGATFEDITDGSCPPCPECGCQATERKLSAPWLKTNPMPFKIQPPRPRPPKLHKRRGAAGCGTASCGSCTSCAK